MSVERLVSIINLIVGLNKFDDLSFGFLNYRYLIDWFNACLIKLTESLNDK